MKDDKRLEHIGIWYEFDAGVKTFEKTMNLYHLNQRHENQGTALFEEMCRPNGLEEPEVKNYDLPRRRLTAFGRTSGGPRPGARTWRGGSS